MKAIVLVLIGLFMVSMVNAYYVSVRDNTFVPAFSMVGIAAGKQVVKSIDARPKQVVSDEVRTSSFRPITFYQAWGVHKGVVVPKQQSAPVTVSFNALDVTRRSNAIQRNINPLNRRAHPGYYIGRYGIEEQYIKNI
ncbi:MAG: hypothetical protein AABX70_07300 [Nanoarchaeota archaeon]